MECINVLPDDALFRIFNTGLSNKDICNCLLVCQKWNNLVNKGLQWKRWIKLALYRRRITEERFAILQTVAHKTSWKTAYLSHYALYNQKHPQFWNDIVLYECFQNRSHVADCSKLPLMAQFSTAPCNGVFWAILQLKLTNAGIEEKVITDMTAQKYLRCGLLVLNRQLGSKFVLSKLREIADVPSKSFFTSGAVPVVSSLLLLQIICGSVHIDRLDTSWPSPATLTLDWKKYFVVPVQATIIKALQIWTEIVCGREVLVALGQQWLTRWLHRIGSEDFWADTSLLVAANRLCSTVWQKLHQGPPMYSLSLSTATNLLDKKVSAKELATRLSSESYQQFLAIPESDLLNYLLRSSHQWSCCNITWFESGYGEKLKEPIMKLCSISQSKKKKVALTERIIEVCRHLRDLRDFRTLKPLVSVVRAIAGQTNITGINWKDLNIKNYQLFKDMEEMFDRRTQYTNYHMYIIDLNERGLSYVPYLAAHRQHPRLFQRSFSLLPKTFSETVEWVTCNEVQCSQSEGSVTKSVHGVQREVALQHLSNTFRIDELLAGNHVLQYFRRH